MLWSTTLLVLSKFAAKLLQRHMLRKRYPDYPYMFFPRQLKFLMDCLEETAPVEGAVLEIGCAYGATTTLLYEYIRDSEFEKNYICIDTFSGFTAEDISYEKEFRNKKYSYVDCFPNDIESFREALAKRGITEIKIIQEDISKIDAARLPRLSFCLLDVDLYKPVLAGLEIVYPLLNRGGICVIDDCWAEKKHPFHARLPDKFDGALEAYRTFLTKHNLKERIVEQKLGVIVKD